MRGASSLAFNQMMKYFILRSSMKRSRSEESKSIALTAIDSK